MYQVLRSNDNRSATVVAECNYSCTSTCTRTVKKPRRFEKNGWSPRFRRVRIQAVVQRVRTLYW
jgi:hypothetical protein